MEEAGADRGSESTVRPGSWCGRRCWRAGGDVQASAMGMVTYR